MFGPGTYTEDEVLLGYLDQQLSAVRTAAHGLTEEQARATPCRSALSVGGILKHVVHVLGGDLEASAAPSQDDRARFEASFALTEEETLAGVLETFDRVRGEVLERLRRTDPAAEVVEPPAPWFGQLEATPSVQRYATVHLIEEVARHAGHADIVREELDGATSLSLLAAVEGWPANPFVQPWTPADEDSEGQGAVDDR